ncbi:MAG TPA: hypothetical protein VFZ00_11230 [Solirubrobacter sp.]|nr:hypothetical protein [Solirubrobacter sp.]
MASELLECRWGKLRLFVANLDTDGSRTLVVHNRSAGDKHTVQNRGLRERRVRCQVQFDDFPGQPSPVQAALALKAAKDSGEVAIFQHPLEGRFLASIGEFRSKIDESSVISAECEFVQDGDDQPVTPTGSGAGGASGIASVTAAAETADTQLANLGQLAMSAPVAAALTAKIPNGVGPLAQLQTIRGKINLSVAQAKAFAVGIANQTANTANSLAADASAIVGAPVETQFAAFKASSALDSLLLAPAGESFDLTTVAPSGFGKTQDPAQTLAIAASKEAALGLYSATTLDARVSVARWQQVDVTTHDVLIDTARISANLSLLLDTLQSDLSLWPAFRAVIMLGDAVRSAAMAATSDTPTVFTMRIRDRCALLPLAARLYGGAQAADRVRQIESLNAIPTPGWLEPGDYTMPTPGARS